MTRRSIDPPPPRVVYDEDWEPPPRSTSVFFTASVLVPTCVALLTIGAAVWVWGGGGGSQGSRGGHPRFPEDGQGQSAPRAESPWLIPSLPRLVDAEATTWGTPAPAPTPSSAPVARRHAPTARPAPAPTARVVTPAYLSVNSTPWAELSVDGHVVGNTPQLRITVASGRHELSFARDGFATQRTWITVEPGATLRITDVTLQRVTP